MAQNVIFSLFYYLKLLQFSFKARRISLYRAVSQIIINFQKLNIAMKQISKKIIIAWVTWAVFKVKAVGFAENSPCFLIKACTWRALNFTESGRHYYFDVLIYFLPSIAIWNPSNFFCFLGSISFPQFTQLQAWSLLLSAS